MDDVDQNMEKEDHLLNLKITKIKQAVKVHDCVRLSAQQEINIINHECIDCSDSIAAERRRAVPCAVRCGYCQTEHEGSPHEH